ncbi:MAG: hypothetical protein LBC64_08105 [Fibromonadaceae bacterium]|nr:hypothetical protein [Fibromonadaceae bacterium]
MTASEVSKITEKYRSEFEEIRAEKRQYDAECQRKKRERKRHTDKCQTDEICQTDCQTDKPKCQTDTAKNGEICEKTAFSAENSHVAGRGGRGGRVGTSVCLSNVSTDVVCNATNVGSIYLNKNQSFNQKEKKDFSKNNLQKNVKRKKNQTRKEWLAMEERAKVYWAITPKVCREISTFNEFAIIFNMIEEDMPEPWLYLAVMNKKRENFKEDFIPAAHNLLKKRPWKNLHINTLNDFSEKKEFYTLQADKFYKEFDKFDNIG